MKPLSIQKRGNKMNIRRSYARYIDADNQFQSAVYQFCHAYQLLLTAYQQKEFSHSAPFMKKATLTFNSFYYLYTAKMSILSDFKSTLHPNSYRKKPFDYLEILIKMMKNRNNQSKKIVQGYTLFQFQVQKGKRK